MESLGWKFIFNSKIDFFGFGFQVWNILCSEVWLWLCKNCLGLKGAGAYGYPLALNVVINWGDKINNLES